jgi:putative ABC transport system ATP-binding protein
LRDVAASCTALSKVYGTPTGRVEALTGVDASFGANEITAVVGPSGSGKTSLLRILAGLERPTGGRVVVCGSDLAAASDARLRRHRRGTATYLSQRPIENFLPQLTLAQHVELTQSADGAAGELFRAFGLHRQLGQRPKTLSGGEQARAAFALALLRGTELVLADEPTAELDQLSAKALLDALETSAARGAALVVATHDPNVIAIAHRVLRLDRGCVVEGPPTEPVEPQRATRARVRSKPLAAEAVRLTKRFRHAGEVVHAVEDVDLAIPHGELSMVIGRSGSGKSTLLGLLGGWHRPDSGELHYLVGAGTRDPATLDWATLAYIPQRFGLVPELTVRENAEHPARLRGTLEADRAWLDELLERLGLTELRDRLPHEISVGQQQRTALARALALKPAIVLADEPTSHQDSRWRDAIVDMLAGLSHGGMTCLVATHEDEVARHADSLWRMHDGRLSG